MKKFRFLFIIIFIITVGYILFVPDFSVNGLVSKEMNHLNVHFDHIRQIEKRGYVEEDESPYIPQNNQQMLDFNIILNVPGDYYSFFVDIRNDSSISVDVEVLSDELDDISKEYIHWSIVGIDKPVVLDAGEVMTIQVIVEYNPEITELPETDIITNYQSKIVAYQV